MKTDKLIRVAQDMRSRGNAEVWIAQSVTDRWQASEVAKALGLYCVLLGPRAHYLLTPNRYSPPDESGYPKTLHPVCHSEKEKP